MLSSEEFLKFNLFKIDLNLPEDINEIIGLQLRITTLYSTIIEMPSFPKVPDSILRYELDRAVGSTTAIEGNTLTQEEIKAAFDKADKKFVLQTREQEVQNSREVYEFIVNEIYKKDIKELSLPLLRQIHKITTNDLPYISNKPGLLRNGQVEFGFPKLPSLFPDQLSVETAVSRFLGWYNSYKGELFYDPVIKALLSHYYLSEIHPFFDGNGRTSRAIEAFCLLTEKVLHPNFFYILANFWFRNRDLYLAELRDVRKTCKANNFVKFGLKGLAEELEYIKDKVKKKVSVLMFNDYVNYLFREKKKKPHKLNKRMVLLLEILVESGKMPLTDFISKPSIRALYSEASLSTRTRDIKKLSENKLIVINEVDSKIEIEANLRILQGLVYNIR